MTRAKRTRRACRKGDPPNSESEDNVQHSPPGGWTKQEKIITARAAKVVMVIIYKN